MAAQPEGMAGTPQYVVGFILAAARYVSDQLEYIDNAELWQRMSPVEQEAFVEMVCQVCMEVLGAELQDLYDQVGIMLGSLCLWVADVHDPVPNPVTCQHELQDCACCSQHYDPGTWSESNPVSNVVLQVACLLSSGDVADEQAALCERCYMDVAVGLGLRPDHELMLESFCLALDEGLVPPHAPPVQQPPATQQPPPTHLPPLTQQPPATQQPLGRPPRPPPAIWQPPPTQQPPATLLPLGRPPRAPATQQRPSVFMDLSQDDSDEEEPENKRSRSTSRAAGARGSSSGGSRQQSPAVQPTSARVRSASPAARTSAAAWQPSANRGRRGAGQACEVEEEVEEEGAEGADDGLAALYQGMLGSVDDNSGVEALAQLGARVGGSKVP